MWLIFGQVLGFLGMVVLVYSEIRMIRTVRSQDMRKATANSGGGESADQRAREEAASGDRRLALFTMQAKKSWSLGCTTQRRLPLHPLTTLSQTHACP